MTNVPLSECAGRGTLYIFVSRKKFYMEIFVAAIIIMMSLSVATFQLIRNAKYRELAERRQKVLSFALYVNVGLIVCDLTAGGDNLGERLLLDVMLSLLTISPLSSSLWSMSSSRRYVYASIMLQFILAMYYLLCASSLAILPDCSYFQSAAVGVSMLYSALFLCGIWRRLREVRAVMHSGTVWTSLTLAVDAFYVAVVLTEFVVAIAVSDMHSRTWLCLMLLLMCGAVAAHGLRIACDTVFVLMQRHERRIVESMKISPVESAGIGQREDDIYKEIYERVLEHFENDKPFLNGNLTINDIVGVVFTNKLYISRAISQYTGRNFCQFVNYHRIMYSVACFRANSELKVAELWPMCGFNSIVSYNMAFRLFMGENPSDWCRKEKIRLSRKEK